MNKIYLVQTDTTVGFLSKNQEKLNFVKNRHINTPCIKSMAKFQELSLHVRVPSTFKRYVRNSENKTFIYPNGQACRVVRKNPHHDFLSKYRWLYSTSANKNKEKFNESFAKMIADEVIEDERGFFEAKPSSIIKLGRVSRKRIR